MSHTASQPCAEDTWRKRASRIVRKEIFVMSDEPIPMLARQLGSNGRQYDPPLTRGSRHRFTVNDARSNKVHPTLTHSACHELNRMGAELIHLLSNERPWTLCNAHIFN